MQKQFAYDGATFPYGLLLEERKTLAATVFPTRSVMVKAPREATDERIEEFLRRRCRWILKQRRFFAQFCQPSHPRYVSGASFRYRGRCYKLLLTKVQSEERVSLQHGVLKVSTASPQNAAHVERLVDQWCHEKARIVFAARLAACLPLFDCAEPPALSLRRMSKRWGSYVAQSHRIILNRDLIKAATRHIDYVIMHELCHVTHTHHTSTFYALLESKCPNWETLKAELELSLLS
jgi:predicted metal-dependent hydrolase